ncbi:hypothetical protein D3C80_2115480 [compost metagenome]
MGQARLGNGNRERPQQGIRQRHRGTTTQAAVECLQRALDTQATDQPPDQRTDDQCNNDMHA